MIIVDACHHVAAFTFESILKSVHAKYIYGLSATPVRKDGHHPIIFMQCGPIRYLVDAKSQAEKRAFSHFVIPRFTRTRLPNAGGIQDLYAGVAVNSDRNDLLIADTLKLIQEGRTPILLTERKEHAAMFASLLEGKVQNVFMLVGSDKQKDKREKLSALQDIPPNEDVVVVATGKYDLAGRVHPKVRATHVASLVSDSLEGLVVPWIAAWRDEICIEAQEHMKVPSFCKDDDYLLKALLYSFQEYAALFGSITMRAFSSKCFHDTKYFERNVRETFLRIARKYDTGLAQSCEESELGEREQLAFLGIYARPELYELAGNCTIQTHQGNIYIGAATPHGLALPSTLVDTIAGIDLRSIQCVTFIENKTNYDEYLISERQPEELVIFHGGFLSPQKRKLFALIGDAASASIKVQFWADIDMGGFRMFEHLPRHIAIAS